ncbi:cation diffusion facilitator family transporter [Phenylobacterium sp.]|uniref:cation diffusion facilitator family transporter n=1 Tax=Phenylobacterium sp. TaxID=1871053 RepID=UPI0035B1DA82
MLLIALVLNAVMFAVETTAGLLGQSTGLLADGLDMLADASAYAVALWAVGRSARFKAGAATLSGSLLVVLGLGVLADVVRRAFVGTEPEGALMVGVAAVALAVNWTVLRLLARVRDGEVHLRATWIFTRADVVANAAVIVSGLLVLATGLRWLDLMVGAGIGAYVIREAVEILGQARAARGQA